MLKKIVFQLANISGGTGQHIRVEPPKPEARFNQPQQHQHQQQQQQQQQRRAGRHETPETGNRY